MEPQVKDRTDSICECYEIEADKDDVLKHIQEVTYDSYKAYHSDQGSFLDATKESLIKYIEDCYRSRFTFYMYPDSHFNVLHLNI